MTRCGSSLFGDTPRQAVAAAPPMSPRSFLRHSAQNLVLDLHGTVLDLVSRCFVDVVEKSWPFVPLSLSCCRHSPDL